MPGRRGGSGGYQRPSTPAAVSGPGLASQRTDGATPKVDLTGFDAQSHGQRSDVEGMASMTGGGGGGGGSSSSPQPAAPTPVDPAMLDAFRPSEFPDAQASSPFYDAAAQAIPDDPDMLLRVLYQQSGHPDIQRLLSMRQGML